MTKYRSHLPQLGGKLFLSDGGIETTLIFNEGLELPDFAAFTLLRTPEVRRLFASTFERMPTSRADFYSAYFAINCAHPNHFERVLADGGAVERIRALRANASRKSHAELNESPELDAGDPIELADDYARLTKCLIRLNVMGGCCGTDHRHIERIVEACGPLFGGV